MFQVGLPTPLIPPFDLIPQLLKPFPALPHLLTTLHGLPNPMLVYASGVDDALKNKFRSPNLQFADGPVNLVKAAKECDVAILNGTHGSAATMLLAGKPALHIPIFLEQGINAAAVAKLGAGINAMPNEPGEIAAGLHALLNLHQFGNAARAFAVRYADFDPTRQIAKLVDRAEQLAA
jgi:UDP:flavonoid glycosyltransferase YjiC (YdhE family)